MKKWHRLLLTAAEIKASMAFSFFLIPFDFTGSSESTVTIASGFLDLERY